MSDAAGTSRSPDRPAAALRWRRWGLRAAAGAAAAAVIALVVTVVLLRSVDQPWLKRRIQALVRAYAGVEVDYAGARVRLLSGAQVENLVVWTPAAFRAIAPELARVGRIEVGWSASSLLGRGSKLERVALDELEITIIADERGRTSLDELLRPGGAPTRAPPSPPRSRAAAEALGAAPPCGRIDVSGVKLTFVRARAGLAADRFALRGLALHAEAHREAGSWRLDASAGSPSAPLPLELVRDGTAGSAQLELWFTAQARPSSAAAALDLRVRAQTVAPLVAVREIAHLEATATFDAARGWTEISVERARAADGAATLEAKLALPDSPGAPVLVRQARGAADLGRLLRLVPPSLVPLQLGRGEIAWRAEGIEVAMPPRLAIGGSVTADTELADARLRLADGTASLASGRWALRANTAGGGAPGGHTSLALRGLRLASGRRHASAQGVDVSLDASRGSDGAWSGTGHGGLTVLRLEGPSQLELRQARAEVNVSTLRFDPTAPLSATGKVEIEGEVASLDARAPQARAAAESVRFRLDAPLTGGPPFAARAEVLAGLLRLYGPDARLLAGGPARLEMRLLDATPDLDRAAASRAAIRAVAELGALRASLDATKHADAVDFALAAHARGLAQAQVNPAADTERAPPQAMTLALSARGRVENLSSANPSMQQQAELRIDRPALRHLQAHQVTLALRSSGDLWRHHADADLWLHPTGTSGDGSEAWHVTMSAELDRRRPSLLFHLAAGSGPATSLSGSLELDRARRALKYDLDGRFGQLAPLGQLLSSVPAVGRFDLSRLELKLAAHGTLVGVVSDVGADGTIRVLPHPLVTAGADGTIEVGARGLRWQASDLAFDVPSAIWRAELWTKGLRRGVRSAFQAEALGVEAGLHEVEAAGVSSELSATFEGGLADGHAEITQRLGVRSLRHDFGAYPIGDLSLTLAAQRRADGVVRVSELRLENGAAGTSLGLRGGIDLGFQRRRFSLRGQLQQDLARFWSRPETFEGRGRLAVTLRVDSSDLSVFHTQAALRLDDVHVRLARPGVAIEALDGEIPITADVAIEGRSVTLLKGAETNPYSLHRFADQHPLISRSSFVSVGSITSPVLSVAPLAGNLKIEQNVVSLSQLEMGVRGGRVTGQCVLDWDGEDSTLRAHVRATGVQSSYGEPFDGNAAVVLSAAERSIDGRIEILRIGSRHLLDLLDLQDPHRTDAATNRIRHALAFGYPDKVRIGFDHGFASMRVTFGGLAKFLSVGDLRGIPTGPLIDKMLASLPKSEEP